MSNVQGAGDRPPILDSLPPSKTDRSFVVNIFMNFVMEKHYQIF